MCLKGKLLQMQMRLSAEKNNFTINFFHETFWIYTTNQKFGLHKIVYSFWKLSPKLTKTFISWTMQ